MESNKTKLMRNVLNYLKENKHAKVSEISKHFNEKFEKIARLLYDLSKDDVVILEKTVRKEILPKEEVIKYFEKGLPEINLIENLNENISVKEVDKIALQWAIKNKWIKIENGKIIKIKDPDRNYIYLKILNKLKNNEKLNDEEINAAKKRKWIEEKELVDYIVELTEKGKNYEIEEEISEITKELIISGGWKKKKIKPFSIKDNYPNYYFGRKHPVSAMIEHMKNIYANMGFIEERTSLIQTAFWNFDALMVPQDHPAREMQDTFYFDEEASLPDGEIVNMVRKQHNKLYSFYDEKISMKKLLRTHMTVTSARTLASNIKDGKYFAIGKVFRNETVDYKHLAELHQVDGIVVGEDLSMRDLVGFLKEFFYQLGFDKIRIRPAYFPFTEPSLEIDVWFESKNNWIELGGAGIFREEIVSALMKEPKTVLAWGLGVERLIMLLFGLNDIRELYNSNLDWLRRRKAL